MLDGQVFGNVVDHSTTNSETGGSNPAATRHQKICQQKSQKSVTFSFPVLRGSVEKILLYQNESKCVEK